MRNFIRAAAMMHFRCLALTGATVLLPSIGLAQSSPNFSYGQVPTAGQYNAAFASKQDRLTFTPLSQAGGTMTGKFQAAPSTVNGAGFALLPGIAPAAPSNGDLWVSSGGLFAQINGSTVALAGGGNTGTMASQNANSVAITGGSINGTSIGSAAPAPGSFTTLSASSPIGPTSGGTGATSIPGAFDMAFGSTQGMILYRSASTWAALSPGTAGQVLTTGGASANPAWATASASAPSGSAVNYSRGVTATMQTITTQTPLSDAVPTTSNTSTVVSVNHTPKAANNLLHVRAVLSVSMNGQGTIVGALFQGSGTSAVAARASNLYASGFLTEVVLDFWVAAPSTAQITFSVGTGCNNGNTVTVNGIAGSRQFGGVMTSHIEVEEFAA